MSGFVRSGGTTPMAGFRCPSCGDVELPPGTTLETLPVYCPRCKRTPEEVQRGVAPAYTRSGDPADNWADLSTLACRTCRFFVPKNDPAAAPGSLRTGRCRRHAPTMDGYPVVYSSDWCGDHKLGTNPSRSS